MFQIASVPDIGACESKTALSSNGSNTPSTNDDRRRLLSCNWHSISTTHARGDVRSMLSFNASLLHSRTGSVFDSDITRVCYHLVIRTMNEKRNTDMSPEIITMIAIGIAIIGIQMTTFLYTLRRMDAMQSEISEVKERMARLEGILIGRLEVGNGTVTQVGDD